MNGSYHILKESAHFFKNSSKTAILPYYFKNPVRTW
jgi:hypothetical protein